MIIKCPGCGRRFSLERRPPVTFCCPKCNFTAPFSVVLKADNITKNDESLNKTQDGHLDEPVDDNNKTKLVAELNGDDHTKIVTGLANENKTTVIPALQKVAKKGLFQVSFNGHSYGNIPLPMGSFDLGRNSSDSNAKVKITPDMAMSRIHAGMRTVRLEGQLVYQITSVKNENPVYVNNVPIKKGKAHNLKNGDKVMMGNTVMIFKIQ